jgi:hypothetical protein
MTHLTRTTQHGLFSTTVAERPNRETGNEMRDVSMSFGKQREAPFAVGVDMTPDQCRKLTSAQWPEYSWPSVSNISPRARGKHY